MAITYTGAGGLFTRLGKIIKVYNLFNGYQGAAASTVDEILDQYTAHREELATFQTNELAWEAAVGAIKVSLIDAARSTIEWLYDDLHMGVRDFDVVMERLRDDMYLKSHTVDANTLSAGTGAGAAAGKLTAGSNNIGTGEVFATSVRPEPSAETDVRFINDEAMVAETARATCVEDAQAGGTAGSERFELVGELPRPDVTSVDALGSGPGPTVQVMFAEGSPNLLDNGDLEDWTASVPDDWTVTGGKTCVQEETTIKHIESTCLEMVGQSTVEEISIVQALDLNDIKPQTTYCVAGWFRTDSIPSDATARMEITGTGWTACTHEEWSDASTFSEGAFSSGHFFFTTPRDVPDDISLKVSLIGHNMTSAQHLYIDALMLAEAVPHGGCRYGLLRGATDFVRGDYFYHTKTNDQGGTIQEFFLRALGTLPLPSDAAGGEDIADSLAE